MSKIDREALVRRHNPRMTQWDAQSPLSVGNGNFAFTADFTGLQTCAGDGPGTVPRCTMSQDGFHSYPDAPADNGGLRLKTYSHGDRSIGYMTESQGQEDLYNRLRINPHRFHMGKVGLYLPGIDDDSEGGGPSAESLLKYHVESLIQELDLWQGTLASEFLYDNIPVKVTALCHPSMSLLSVKIESPLIAQEKLGLGVRFPYGSHEIEGADWYHSENHSSRLTERKGNTFIIDRVMDDVDYAVQLQFKEHEEITCHSSGQHSWCFTGSSEILEFSLLFYSAREEKDLPDFEATSKAGARFWETFWNEGGAVSFEGSTHPGAMELERRVILSQYLLRIQSLGSLPPAETGLTCNSWYGKFHLEMHPWHALYALIWNRGDLVTPSLEWYRSIQEGARKRAEEQGYKGVRWPKMTDPSGRDSPSPIGCLLCWQQPHYILFAELLYRLSPTESLLEHHADLVFQTAEFMADYPQWDPGRRRYVLAPPLIPAQENHASEETLNPLFELEYWRWGLSAAIEWKKRIKAPVPEKWSKVLKLLSSCPLDPENNYCYGAHENCRDSYGYFGTDHPSMLLACGFLPPQTVELSLMENSYEEVLKNWRWETMWGWDFPSMAMTLARLGRRKEAAEVLLKVSPKNRYMANGHNRQEGHGALPLYLPGNGALLLAVGMMAAGWDGSHEKSPGFSAEDGWKVTCEELVRYI